VQPLRIVIVLVEPPLPFGDAAARWYYVLLKGLVARGHRVTAFASCSRSEQAAEARRLFPAPEYDLRTYPVRGSSGFLGKVESFRRPFSYLFDDDFRCDLARELASGFDVLHLEQLWSGWLGLEHLAKAVLHIHYLFRIDLAGEAGPRALGGLLYPRVLASERKLLKTYPNITTLSARLTDAVTALSPWSRVETVPLGIDASLYPFDPAPMPARRPTVGLIGSFGWQPSYIAAERLLTRLWPEIARRVPEARLQVVGRRARSALSAFAETPGLEIAEDVPDAIPYFHATDVMLYAPPQGSGMKVKVLEAFALGTPVVTNAEGVEGLPAVDGVHAGIADDDAGLIERTVALLRDAEARQARRHAARRILEDHCGPGPTVNAMEVVYARVAGMVR
jgi:glycosyltransferase involved in cell wall biosynthesis